MEVIEWIVVEKGRKEELSNRLNSSLERSRLEEGLTWFAEIWLLVRSCLVPCCCIKHHQALAFYHLWVAVVDVAVSAGDFWTAQDRHQQVPLHVPQPSPLRVGV